ncbi:MAG: 2-dehydropantoate 2-reductase [Wigglesworthia glossinidia]|nr:2-dehydropantoate 2-reductase [Wigglesworthia glossinidia]
MKITVLGCGVIGKIWLSYFIKKRYSVQGWLKKPKNFFNFQIKSVYNIRKIYQTHSNNFYFLQNSDILLVTLKSWQILAALRQILPELKKNCSIVIIQNGMGIQEKLTKIKQPLFFGITTHAGYLKNCTVHHSYYGKTYIGPGNISKYFYRSTMFTLNNVLPKVIWKKNILYFAWLKLAVNCVINPLSVIYNCKNGELLKYKKDILTLLYEISLIMNSKGYNINKKILFKYILSIIYKTKDNISSMLQDFIYNKKSEIDYINGYIIHCSMQSKIHVPYNTYIFELIKKKESIYLKN